ncbi:MAG TPA: hypothetical protein VKW09_05875 [bacterium]|nr:hypothetical protein [bacterium]
MRILPLAAFIGTWAVVFGLPFLGAGQDRVAQIQTEIQTATFHATELAQRATTVAGVQLHTHHVLNCLEGPNGADYFAEAADPCSNQGGGIIPDLRAAAAHHVPGAENALREATIAQTLAKQALASKDLNEAQPFLLVLARHLQAASLVLGK